MSFFWPDNENATDEETLRLYSMRRKVYLGCVLLVSLVCFETILFTSTGVGPLWLRIFNYMLCIYAVGLVVYATIWFYKCWLKNRREKEKARRDPLTGFLNRAGLLQFIHDQWNKPEEAVELRLIYVKLLGLAQCNNVHGQATGDRVLRQTAEMIREELPDGCVLGRVAGAEFVVIVRCAHLQTARKLKARLEERIEDHSFVTGDVDIHVRTAMAADVSGSQTLRDVLSDVRLQTNDTDAEAEVADESVFHSVPQVSLEACARFNLQNLDKKTHNEFYTWKKYPEKSFLDRMAQDIVELLSLRAGKRPFDFVTSPPVNGSEDDSKSVQRLAQRVADLLDSPYRRVMVASSLSPSMEDVEPKVAAPVEDGSYVLFVSDLMDKTRYLRRCVQRLSKAGAIVQPVGWAANV